MDDTTVRLSKWASGDKAAPQRVLLYPTNSCNLKCLFCFQRLNPYDYSDIMPKSKWLAITKELCEMKVDTLQISGGGEPFLAQDTVLDMMKITKKYAVNGRLVTNGTLLTEDTIKFIIELGWDNIIFSIDGPDAKTHDRLRGIKGAFDRTTASIKSFTKLKKEFKSDKPLLEFSSVLCKVNYKKIKNVIKLAYDTGVKVVTFEPVFVSNPYVHKLKLTEKQREEFMFKIVPLALTLANSLGIITNLHTLIDLKTIEKTGNLKGEILNQNDKHFNKPFYNAPCFEPWIWPKIEANGEVGPCSTNLLKGENIKNKTFTEVWYGKTFNEFRKKILQGQLPEGCANCVSTHLPMNCLIRKKLLEHDATNRH